MNHAQKLNLIAAVVNDNLDELYMLTYALVKQRDIDNVPNMPPVGAAEFYNLSESIVTAIVSYKNRIGCTLSQARAVCEAARDAIGKEANHDG